MALTPCPDSPNCVCTEATDDAHRILPYRYTGEGARAVRLLKQVVAMMQGAKLVEERELYLRYEFTSRLFRFVDDVEFQVDDVSKTVQFRSASRTGYGDFGVNRKRMDRIRSAFDAALNGNRPGG